jgi:putative transposase
MSHTINHQYIHLVWPTKNLLPLIAEDSVDPLLAYLAGILIKLGGQLVVSSGTTNHVHLLVNTPTDLSIADLLSQIKSCSSKWYREKYIKHSTFSWNEGYSAFTVSPSSIDKVKQYLAAEGNRHKKSSFEDELMGFLKNQEIVFNPKFLTTTTYTKLVYHLVWSVKNRENFLNTSLQGPLHHHMHQEIQKSGGKLYAIGNVVDHIHLLVEGNKKISLATLVQNLKTSATYLIRSHDRKYASFNWQEGYGVFSVGMPALESLVSYVNNQEEHHKVKTFEQEWNWLREMNNVVP